MSDSTYEFAPQEPLKGLPPEKSASAPAPAPLPVDAVKDWTCPHCGFVRVGKPARGRCPECSGQMEVGPAADLLQFARAGWLRTLSWGALLASLGLMAQVAIAVLGLWMREAWLTPAQVGAAAALAGGMWLLTLREAGGTRARQAWAGQIARWSAVAALILWGVFYWTMKGYNPAGFRVMIAALCAVQAGVAFGGGFFLSAMSTRIPQDSLSTQFLNIAWLVPAVLALVVIDLFAGLQAQFGFLFYCVFPTVGVMAGLMLWPAAALIHLALELRSSATAGDSIIAKREARAAKAAAKPHPQPLGGNG